MCVCIYVYLYSDHYFFPKIMKKYWLFKFSCYMWRQIIFLSLCCHCLCLKIFFVCCSAIIKLQNIKYMLIFSMGMAWRVSRVMIYWFFAMEILSLILRELLFPFKNVNRNESCILLNNTLISIKVLTGFSYFAY